MTDEGSGLRLSPEHRFATALDRLCPQGSLGLAVSGGPDSLALLLLAAAARPGEVEAATVDHGLRPESGAEAAMVAEVCARMGVKHSIFPVTVPAGASSQRQAREARYEALGGWARQRGLCAIATAHHADDQAETLLMRLARGSGLAGLAGVREQRPLMPGVRLIRPLLDLRKSELVALVEAAGLKPVDDPSNHDGRHDRTRVRALLGTDGLLDPLRLARSAAALGEAEEALQWTVAGLAAERLRQDGPALLLSAGDLPPELQRRLLLAGLKQFGVAEPRGTDVERALARLRGGAACTLGGIKLEGGAAWRLSPAPPRRRA